MSAVFRLRHRRTGLTVAGKRIQKGCEVHRSGVCDTDTDFWTVLELCAGGRLAVFLEKFPRKADPVALQLCQARQLMMGKCGTPHFRAPEVEGGGVRFDEGMAEGDSRGADRTDCR
ncbi:unnamed protein product [Durusdinium trenchii]|uniref:Protein kinase domain-containing protein n=1 Tax=Durusdinium trenchii TaxID=1381693 RepID=A0ABP0R1P2_9DINO